MRESIKSALKRAEKCNVLVGHEKCQSKSSPPSNQGLFVAPDVQPLSGTALVELSAQFSFHLVNTNRTPSSSGLTVFNARS